MTAIELKGINKVARRYPRGVRLDLYAGRDKGAVRIGSYRAATLTDAEAMANADAAGLASRYEAARRSPASAPAATVAGLVKGYRGSPEFNRLSAVTQRVWRRWLDRVESDPDLGPTPLRIMDSLAGRAVALAWRDIHAEKPRTADYAVQVLSRVLAWGVDRGKIGNNRAAKIGHLWEADLSDDIWEEAHLSAFTRAARKNETPERAERLIQAVEFIAHTGFRIGDAVAVTWDAVKLKAGEIRWKTSKSGRKNEAVIPITPALRKLLKAMPRAGETVLVSGKGIPYATGDTLSEAIQIVAKAAGINRRTHDLRGTAATYFRLAGLTVTEISRILGWSEKQAEKIIDIYVNPGRVSRALARRITRGSRFSGNGAPA